MVGGHFWGGCGGGRVLGLLTEWNIKKACGFIETEDGASKRFFAHKTEFEEVFDDFASPPLGCTVSFVVGCDPKSGKERACQIRLESAPGAMRAAPSAFGSRYSAPGPPGGGGRSQGSRLYGSLAQWDAAKACGFIDCTHPAGRRFFAHKTEFEGLIADDMPWIGMPLSFVAGTDARSGKERACQIRSEHGGAGFGGAGFGGGSFGGCAGFPQSGGAFMVPVQPPMRAAPAFRPMQQIVGYAPSMQLRLAGTLSEWRDDKACGFIECPDMTRRLFAHKSDFAEHFEDGQAPPSGTPLTFVVGVDSKSGKQRAQEIRIGHDRSGGGPRLNGTICEFNDAKACGFIMCTSLGKKYFAHKSEFAEQFPDGQGPPIGTVVSFVHGYDEKSGKERARDIRLGEQDEERLYGWISEWRDAKACGFIETVEGSQRYFAHKTEFAEPPADGLMTVGVEVNFLRGIDARSGKERAIDIRVEDHGRSRIAGEALDAPARKRPRLVGELR